MSLSLVAPRSFAFFRDRTHAGTLLADHLSKYANRRDVTVLGLPRGGVPVAAAVARQLHAPLDIIVVRKLGVPGNPELAMGAIAPGGRRVLNEALIDQLGLPSAAIEAAALRETRELDRRTRRYRGNRVPPELRERTVIVVDDGVATGATMLAALAALRGQHVQRIVVAAPTIAPEALPALRHAADEVVAVLIPDEFTSVGEWFEDFAPTEDAEVRRLLSPAKRRARK